MSMSDSEQPAGPAFTGGGSRAAPGLALFLDRPHLRDQLADDARAMGFAVLCAAPLDVLADAAVPAGAAVVLVDCPLPDARSLAALAVQDLAARDGGARLIVATTLAGLEDVFACLDQSQPQLLVDPSAADLAIALGHAFMQATDRRLRELAEDDRRRLIQLTEMVVRLVERFERPDRAPPAAEAGRLGDPAIGFRGASEASGRVVESGPSPLPSPALVRQVLRWRQQRARFFDPALFADPAWDMLLDLTAAHGEGKPVSVTSLCIASGVPPTTALRWIGVLTEADLLRRSQDGDDRRRVFIGLTDKAIAAMTSYFAAIGGKPPPGI
ncbi:MAG TPA: winged helix DNA-binding protein [Novosphingobium sp.]